MLPRYKVRGVRNRFAIDLAGSLSTPIADLPLDPYLLGVWLGNGSASMNHITVHESDVEFLELLADCGIDVRFRLPWWRKGRAASILVDAGRRPSRDDAGRFTAVKDQEDPSSVECLRDLGILQNKHIPTRYLRASISQRLALFQGLMDTDGHCTKLGRLEFSPSSERIRDGVYELIMSLGMKATVYARDQAAGFRKYPKRHYRFLSLPILTCPYSGSTGSCNGRNHWMTPADGRRQFVAGSSR
jgi:LAGLIDADG-like domain